MKRLLLALPLMAATPAKTGALPKADREQLRCVATLAIVANDQARGAPGWEGFPDVTSRGTHLANRVVDRVVKERGLSQDRVRAIVIEDIRALQEQAIKAKDPQVMADGLVRQCIALMDQIDPLGPEPGMPRCAALASVAHLDMKAQSGPSNEAIAMATLASVLDSEARKELRAAGQSDTQSDVTMGLERERVEQTRTDDAEAVFRNGEDLRRCMAMVKPQPKEVAH